MSVKVCVVRDCLINQDEDMQCSESKNIQPHYESQEYCEDDLIRKKFIEIMTTPIEKRPAGFEEIKGLLLK